MGIFKKLFDTAPPTRDEFAAMAVATMTELGWTGCVYDPGAFNIRTSESSIVGLSNAFKRYSEAPKPQRETVLREFFEALRDQTIPSRYEDAKESLMPMLRLRSENLQYQLQLPTNGLPATEPLARPFADFIELKIVYDRPKSVTDISRAQLTTWGVDEETAFAVATRNLRLKSADAWKQVAPNVFLSAWHDTFDATRMIFPDLLRRVAVPGRPVVFIPNRDHLIVAGEGDSAALAAASSLMAKIFDAEGNKLWPEPFVLDDDACKPFPITDPDGYDIRARKASIVGAAYELQKQLRAKVSEDSPFVAKYMANGNEQQRRVFLMATWSAGVATLLPKTELILFFFSQSDGFFVRWEDVESVIGPLVPLPDIWPPLYRATEFPNPEQLTRLRAMTASLK